MSELFDNPSPANTVEVASELPAAVVAEVEEFKKTLAPLSEMEEHEIARARAEEESPPVAANEPDDMLKNGALLTELDAEDVNLVDDVKRALSTNSSRTVPIEYFTAGGTVRRINPDGEAVDVSGNVFTVAPSNNFANLDDAFTTFHSSFLESQMVEEQVTVRRKDKGGKTYFHFERPGIYASAIVIVFPVNGKQMIKLGDLIMPLEEMLSITKCTAKTSTQPRKDAGEVPVFELRRSIDMLGGVECTFGKWQTVHINGIDVGLAMEIVHYLSSIYGKSDEEEPVTEVELLASEQQPMVVAEKPREPQEEYDDCALILFSTISIAALMNLLMTFILWQSSISGGYYNLKREYN
jgi:hypothetical protein